MKRILIALLFALPFVSKAQTDDTTKYVYYQFIYGNALDRYWAKKVMLVPADTIYSKDGIAVKNGVFYVGNGTKWSQVTGAGSGADSITFQTKYRSDSARVNIYAGISSRQAQLSNSGSGYRVFAPSAGVKTLFKALGITIDSTTNTNGLTFAVDTSYAATLLALKDTAAALRLLQDTSSVLAVGGPGDSLLRAAGGNLYTPKIRDSLNFHHTVNPDGSWTLYSIGGGGSSPPFNDGSATPFLQNTATPSKKLALDLTNLTGTITDSAPPASQMLLGDLSNFRIQGQWTFDLGPTPTVAHTPLGTGALPWGQIKADGISAVGALGFGSGSGLGIGFSPNGTSRATLSATGLWAFLPYNSPGAVPGTIAAGVGFDASGNIITTGIPPSSNDLGNKNYYDRFGIITQYIPAGGLASSGTTVTNYPFGALDSTQMPFTTSNPYPVAGTKRGGIMWTGTGLGTTDSVLLTAPKGILAGSSFDAAHSAPWHHWSRLEYPAGASGFLYNMIDSVGTLAYYMRQLTGYRWYPQAIGGQTSGQLRGRWARDVLGQTIITTLDGRGAKTINGLPYVVFFDGVGNDPYALGASVQGTINNLIYFAQSCQENGILFICSISTTTAGVSLAGDQFVQAVNKFIENGGLDRYGAVIFDMRKYWSDPAWFYDGTHGNPNYINSTDNTHFTSGQGGASAGYDSLAIAIVNQCHVPKLTKIIFNTNLSPTSPVTQLNYITSARIDGTLYSSLTQNDTFNLISPLGNGNGTGGISYNCGDSIWVTPLTSGVITGSGTQYGLGIVKFVMDNTNGGRDTSFTYTRRTRGLGGPNTNLDISSILVRPENPLLTAALIAMENPGGTGFGFEVHPAGTGSYVIINGNGSGQVALEKLTVYGNINAVNSSILALGNNSQFGNINVGYNGSPVLDQGIGLTNSLLSFYSLATNAMANPIFSFNSLVPRPNITVGLLHIGELIDTIGQGQVSGNVDTVDKIYLRQTLADTVTAKTPSILGGLEIERSYNPLTIGSDRIPDIWTHYGDVWLNTDRGITEIGAKGPAGANKLDIVDTARGIRIPRLTQTQINNMGYVKSVTVTAGGTGYNAGIPKVTFVNSTGTFARGNATVTAGAVSGIVMLDGGIDYTGTTTITLSNSTGTGATFTVNVVVADTSTMVFNLTTGNYQFYNGSGWTVLSTGGGAIPGFGGNVQTVPDAGYTVVSGDETIIFTTTFTANRTLTIPAASGNNGRHIRVHLFDISSGGTFHLVISCSSSIFDENNTPVSSFNVSTTGEVVDLSCDGIEWYTTLVK